MLYRFMFFSSLLSHFVAIDLLAALNISQQRSGVSRLQSPNGLIQFSFLGLYQNLDLQTRVNYLEGCECVRQQCVWEGREVEEGRRWQVDPNTVCLCSSGKVTCQTSKRDAGNINLFIALFITSSQGLQETVPGDCCQQCRGCTHSGVRHDHGARWRSAENPCDLCSCLEGHVHCEREECSTPCDHPSAPPPNSCCPVCQGCGVNGLEFPNKAAIPTGDRCQECTCENGNVVCSALQCPTLTCHSPVHPPGDCCPRCEQCEYESEVYVNGQKFSSLTDPCLLCRCSTGNVICYEEKCPPVQLSSLLCVIACVLEGVEYEDGSTWQPEGPCSSCTCVNGETLCSNIQCLSTECLHPSKIPGSCCEICDSCTFNHRIYSNGQRFTTPDQPCHICTCLHGSVRCERQGCPPLNCTNSYTRPGDCCPKCPDCSFENRVFVNGEAFPNPVSECEECTCVSGRIDCHQTHCPHPRCNAPLPGTCCQNNCNGCLHQGRERTNGETWEDPSDSCAVCVCHEGSVQCERKRCPPSNCNHPVETDCCRSCDGCFYNGVVLVNGQSIPDPGNPCSECACQSGSVRCSRKPCPAASCPHPVTSPCGCPVCDGCHFQGVTYADGQVFHGGEQKCQDCTCSVSERICPSAPCAHPALDGCACRVCDGCNFNGRGCYNGEQFPHPEDHCQSCFCLNGGVVCAQTSCPSTTCRNPVMPPGECCPVCTGRCFHQGAEHESGSTFTSPSDPCSTCTCLNEVVTCQSRPCPVHCLNPIPSDTCCPICDDCFYEGVVHTQGHTFASVSSPCERCTCVRGTVSCVPVVCPPTACDQPVTEPGQCCPECTGCMYGGQQHAEGSSWFADSNPCMTCMCVDGVTTCSEVHCVSPCVNFMTVPGECCPVCADCIFEGRVYGPGDSFHPANDPCQICTCEVMPDGQQHLKCYRKQCPSLVDCPKSNILFPGPDSCCPVCAQPLTNCTSRLIGNEVLATDDPCFTCQCQDLTWTCLQQTCPTLSCPSDEHFTPPDSCCPVYSRESCLYQGTQYYSDEHWQVDECTNCMCVSGDVHCRSERCPPLTCAADEMPAVIPGLCCPHCLPRPATCIAFGDPHYRTFDGRMFHFQGTCTYILTKDCKDEDFSVHVTNDDRGRKGVSWTKEVTVFIRDVAVQLLQEFVVKVNEEVVTLPFLREPYIFIERQANTVLLNTNIGLKVLWSPRSHLEVSVPGSYKESTCGLCGNFNKYPQDDLQMSTGKLTTSESDFGNSWRHSLSSCRPGEDVDPCKSAGYQARKGANTRCKVLRSTVFKPCHRVVPPEPWYAACVYDLCACGANTDECLCDALEAYASQCREAGVILQWRSTSLCAVGCPVERGFVFDECGPPCPVTCFNADVPLGVIESHCFKPCVPGCQCPAGLVLHNNYCIQPEKCPKIIHGSAL
uniref:Kielin cysteine rich BMP regulator n=1 Tax=Xiphophorus couchianus TaxID=32473 RepID=A0A3B5N165_9TELE